MSARLTKAVLTISVDLDGPSDEMLLAERRQREATCQRLADMFAAHQIPVTWSSCDPATSPRFDLHGAHELALAAESGWPGESADRAAIARQLTRRLTAAEDAGTAISTLVVSDGRLSEHLDLIIKHGITAVRHPADLVGATASNRMQPGRLRFGLWSFPVACELPGPSRWLRGGGGGHVTRRLVDRAIVERGLVHLVVALSRLAVRGRAAEHVLANFLVAIGKRRRQGTLEVATIGATAARLASQQESRPSRSILRPAA